MKHFLTKSAAVFVFLCFFLPSYSEAVTYNPSEKLKDARTDQKTILQREKRRQEMNLEFEKKRLERKSKELEKQNTLRKNKVGAKVLKESQKQTKKILRDSNRETNFKLRNSSQRILESSTMDTKANLAKGNRLNELSWTVEAQEADLKDKVGAKVLKESKQQSEKILKSSQNTRDLILLKELERQKNDHRKAAGDTYIPECRWPLKQDGTCMKGWNDIKNILCKKGYFNVMIVGGVDGGLENAGGMPYAAIEKWTCRPCPIGFYCPGNNHQYECPEARSTGMVACPEN